MAVAKLVAARVPGSKLVQYTEDNDPNSLLGRPNGYSDGANIQWLMCDDPPSVDCGAVVEVWGSEGKAIARAKYIQGVLSDNPALGSEYAYVKGKTLIRVSGTVKPSQAKTLNVLDGTLVEGE